MNKKNRGCVLIALAGRHDSECIVMGEYKRFCSTKAVDTTETQHVS